MTSRDQLIKEIEQAPEFLVEEVLNFLLFTKARQHPTPTPRSEDINGSTENQIEQKIDRPIWELFEEFTKNIPEDVLAQLPTDGAEQHDHYIYGTPKHSL